MRDLIVKRSILVSIVTALMIASLAGIAPATAWKNNFSSGVEEIGVIVGFKERPDPDLFVKHGGKIRYEYSIIPAIAGVIPKERMDDLRKELKVSYVEIDGEVKALGETLPWGIDRIDADKVWDIDNDSAYDGSGVKIAILDTGIDWDHPDLSSNCGDLELRENMYGYDFVNDDNDPMDDHGHGTWCAGIAASANNGKGVIGADPDASLFGVKVLDSDGTGTVSDVIAGIEWSIKYGMDIISMSIGTDSDYESLHDACDKAYSESLLPVAAAGNDGNKWGTGNNVDYPARYSSVIAVGATDKNDERAVWSAFCASSTGPAVELAAPGDEIPSTWWDDTYETHSGTSAACPHVSGTAALVFVSYPNYTSKQVRERLDNTAEDMGPEGRDEEFGYGLVDAEAAAVTGKVEKNMHVGDIKMTTESIGRGPWTWIRAVTDVPILDADGKPVEVATVEVEWSGLVEGTDSGETNADGIATFKSKYVKNAEGTFTITVINVTKSGWTYDSGANVENSESIMV